MKDCELFSLTILNTLSLERLRIQSPKDAISEISKNQSQQRNENGDYQQDGQNIPLTACVDISFPVEESQVPRALSYHQLEVMRFLGTDFLSSLASSVFR